MLGRRVAQVRIRRSLTQEQLAERAEISKVTVSQLEQGLLDGIRLTTLCGLADALEVTVTSLFEAEPENDVKEQDNALLLPLRRLLLPAVRSTGSVDEKDLAFPRLRKGVWDATADFEHARYAKLTAEVPGLVESIEAAVGLTDDEAQAALYRLLAHSYVLTAQILVHLRSEDLACEAVRRAMEAAEKADDPLLRASAASNLSWAFTRQGMFADAEMVAVRTADEIGEPSIAKATPGHLAIWGKLLMEASNAAAQDNRPDTAQEWLSLAHTAAVRLGHAGSVDYEKHWSLFNTAMVNIVSADNALFADDAPLALRLGRTVQRPANLHRDWWASFLLTMAEAQTSTRDYAGAIETMKAIRGMAPEWIKNRRVAHEAVLRLLDATTVRRARSSGLAELAVFMDVKP